MKVTLSADDINLIEIALNKPGTSLVEVKREQRQITVLAVSKQRITKDKTNQISS